MDTARMLRLSNGWEDLGHLDAGDELVLSWDLTHDDVVVARRRRATLPDPARVVAHLVPRARIVTHAEMGAALAQVREDVMGIFDLALIELEASTYPSEAFALMAAELHLSYDDIPAALATLRGWLNKTPWSTK